MTTKPGLIDINSPQFAIGIAGDSPCAGTYYSSDMERTSGTDGFVFRQDGLPVSVESNITTLSEGAISVRLRLCNGGGTPLSISLFAPLATGAMDCTAYVPQISGKVEPVREANYITYAPGQLAAPFLILQDDGAGVALAQEKSVEDEGNYRTGVLVNGTGLPGTSGAAGAAAVEVGSSVVTKAGDTTGRDLGGVACFVDDAVLPAGRSMDFGPYVVACYRGGWTAGAERLRELRRPRPMRPRPPWMRSVIAAGELAGRYDYSCIRSFADLVDASRDLAKAGAPLFMLWAWWDRTEEQNQPNKELNKFWNYAFGCKSADAELGGDSGLQDAITRVRAAGSKILLYIDPWQIADDSAAGRYVNEHNWATHTEEGKSPVGGDYLAQRPCPALPEVRKWIVDGVVDIFKRYRPDGFYIDEMCAAGYTTCHNVNHNHPHPYVWAAALIELCKALRAALDEIDPEAILLSEGGTELLREYLDGYLATTGGWTSFRNTAPVTRAVVKDVGIFEAAHGTYEFERHIYEYFFKMDVMPMDVEHMAALNFVSGIPYYVTLKGAGRTHPINAKHHAYLLAFPEMLKGDICAEQPVFDPGTVIGTLFHYEGAYVLAVADTRTNFSLRTWTKVSMPVGRQLYNRVQAEFIPIVAGVATLELGPYEAAAFEVIL